jgi:membrane-associated phospholipid phosphatase
MLLAALLVAATTTTTTAAPAPATELPELEWNESWPRFRTPEYVATGVLIVVNSIGGYIVPIPKETRWHNGILFDDAARKLVINMTHTSKFRLKVVGDYLFPGLAVMPIVLDGVIVSWLLRGSFEVAWEMSLIALQSLLTSSILNLLSKRLTARARPNVPDCIASGRTDCEGGGAIRSFYSGHAGLAATGAGLLCVQHEYLDLFGGGLADHLTCAAGIAGAVVVGMSRVINDAHYASDSVAGMVVGLATGVLMPVWLHYGVTTAEPRLYVAPSAGEGTVAVTVGGVF